MFRILKKSLKTGIVTGRYQETAPREASVPPEADQKARPFRRSLTIREVDTGSCNACEMEMNALMNPIYDPDRFGVHIAASPRHADALVVTGPVTVNMEQALKEVYRTTPDPKLVIPQSQAQSPSAMTNLGSGAGVAAAGRVPLRVQRALQHLCRATPV